MATYKVTFEVSERLPATVERKLKEVFGKPDMPIHQVERVDKVRSRAERRDDAVAQIRDAHADLTGLQEELQEWHDNLPENLQSGDKADMIEEAATQLSDSLSDMEAVLDTLEGVELPSMM